MALPRNNETLRGRYLQSIVDACKPDDFGKWPMPTKDDYAVVGALIVIYSYIDFHLRRLVEMLDIEGALDEKYRGKSSSLNLFKVQEAIRSASYWSEANLKALDLIEEHRPVRNMVAHFVLKRFPNEDAYVFVTKSASDFRQAFGVDMPLGVGLTAVVDAVQLRQVVKVAEGLLAWLAKATVEIEKTRKPQT